MCQSLPLQTKALSAGNGFPDGWKFAFDGFSERVSDGKALVVLSPNERRYHSVESAIKYNKLELKDVDASKFYAYVGYELVEKSNGGERQSFVGDEEVCSVESSNLDAVFVKRQNGSCGSCSMCVKPRCGICLGCTMQGIGGASDTNVCLLKVSTKARISLPLPPSPLTSKFLSTAVVPPR
jgi:hypothetical protein